MGSLAAARQGEPELSERARSGDRDALVQLYRRHRDPLFRHAFRMLGDQAGAQDVVQEAFARALVKVSETRPGLNFRAWIYRIVTNLCLRELDRRGRARPDPDPDARHGEVRAASHASMRREVGERLAAALARLPDRYRQVLLLRELDELSYAELAQVLEISEANVKVLLHRARQRFAALFVAGRLLEEPDAATGCAELAHLVGSGARDAIERHLERCERCRQLENRPAGELLALLPPVPAAVLPELPGPSSSTGSAAAGAGVAAASPLVVGALVLGAALLVGVVAGAAVTLLRSDPVQPGAATPGAATKADPTQPAPAVTRFAPQADNNAPAASRITAHGPATHRPPPGKPRRPRRPRTSRRHKAPAVTPQIVDPEAPPAH